MSGDHSYEIHLPSSHEAYEAALRYAKRGWHCFPCKPNSKAPATRHGLHDATTVFAQLERMFAPMEAANVAVATGRASGIVVVDIDGDEGHDSLARLEEQYGNLPATASTVTPRGGAHLFFKHPGGRVPCSTSRLGPAIDVRGDGGYVLLPPSRVNRRPYEVDQQAKIATMPPWLEGLCVMKPAERRRAVPAEEWITMVRTGIPEGRRNADLTRFTGHLLSRGVDARLVLALAHLVNRGCKPPLAAGEVDRIVESIAARELQKFGGRA